MSEGHQRQYELYSKLIESGVSREVARTVLPLSLYTEMYWQIDLHNLFNFLRQRLDTHAQYEIRAYAETMAEVVAKVAPVAWEAFQEHVLER
jgi:thymidylate synthase (FAD)